MRLALVIPCWFLSELEPLTLVTRLAVAFSRENNVFRGARRLAFPHPHGSRGGVPSTFEASRVAPEEFERLILPHLDAAYNLARWLMRNRDGAEDVVQDAMLRAQRYFPSFRGRNERAWLLQIVRNTAYASIKSTTDRRVVPLDSVTQEGDEDTARALADPGDDPETALMREQDRRTMNDLLGALPLELRECIVLRELEDLSYAEIARIAEIPIGTVMSRLWRARRMLQRAGDARKDAR